MIQPLKKTYRVTTPFKYKSNLYYNGYHTGVDFATPTGTQVVAANAGTVVASQFDNSGFGYGEYITIYDGKYYWRYAHLNHRSVGKGTKVKTGQLIGRTGNTGLSTAPHLHFECSTSNSFTAPISSYKDPLEIIKKGGNMIGNKNHVKHLFTQFVNRQPTANELETYSKNTIGWALGKLHPARTDLPQTVSKLRAAEDKITQLEAKVEALQKERGEDSQLLDEAGSWLTKLSSRLFKKGE